VDLAIKDTTLITFKDEGPSVIKNGAVGVEMDKICFVGKTEDLDEENYTKIIDGSDHVTMPGLIDAHIHSGLSLLRGTAQDVPEIEWMDKALGPIVKHLEKSDFITGSKLGILEGLRSGTTTFGEFTSDLDETIEKVHKPFGTRVVGAETINEIVDKKGDIYELESSDEQFQKADDLFDRYAQSDLIDITYGPQALDMVTLETLRKIKHEADEYDRCIHMHVAQGGRERKQIKSRYGCSTVEKLKEEEILQDNLLAAHCHDTTDQEKKTIVESETNMVGCPSSIATIDGIVPPIHRFLSLGGNACLGTDQIPGNGAHNIFREMRTISLLSKCLDGDPTALPAWKCLKIATKNGAKALGLKDKIGSLEEGKKADLITVDLKNTNLSPSVQRPFRNIIPNLVYSSTGMEVDNVFINGRKVLRDGKFISIDEERIKKEAEERAKKVLSEAEESWRRSDSKMVEYERDDLL